MNIILAEESADGSQAVERSFDKGVILIGRDAACDITFDSELYKMVSRKHAELRWHESRWILVDLNSSYGTFLNGQRVTAPVTVGPSSRIQFGQSGPVFRIVWFQVMSDGVNNPALPQKQPSRVDSFQVPQPVPAKDKSSVPAANKAAAPVVPQMPSSAQLDFITEQARQPFTLAASAIWLGREASCEIVFDASAVMVSRKHAEIRFENGSYLIDDNNSFNGTLINEQRISAATPLYHDDEIRLGIGGPVMRFNSPSRVAPVGSSLAGQRILAAGPVAGKSAPEIVHSKTMVLKMNNGMTVTPGADSSEPQLLMSLRFGSKKELTIGRDDGNDIKLDGLQISNRHARLLQSGSDIVIDDLNSTNGVYVNGTRATRQTITPNDAAQIGSFMIRADPDGNIGVFDTRSKTRIDAVNLVREVKNRLGGGRITLLDSISLSIHPNEFVGLLGPSGSGKSTLMDALNGMRPANSGSVLVNNLNLYRYLDSLKQAIGYVPQDDVIHRELTVYRTLYYTAKLRLSRDVSSAEINQTINEILDVTGLAERRDVRISQLSGGQRKRVSIAVELITKPSVIFLDEPTSGLDPATEEKIMNLFRQIAESGRTVIMTTHAMENVRLFDKIVMLMRGKLVFYGKPEEALKQFGASSFKHLYDKLEEPIRQKLDRHSDSGRLKATDEIAEEWKQKFIASPQYRQNIYEPLRALGQLQPAVVHKKHRLGIFGAIRQWITLSQRYFGVLLKDKLNLLILFAQAPIIALLTFLVMDANRPRDFVYFVISLVAVWFGTSVSAREIIRERPVFRRERMVNLGILPYLASKLFVIGIIVGIQCLMLFAPLKLLDLAGIMPMPGEMFGIPQFWVMLLTAAVGIALGLLISALVRTSEMATSLVPLILIPQIIFSGLVGVPSGINKAVSLMMPAAWSFDTMKRFSTLDTLEQEGAEPNGKTAGLGLYKYTENENEKLIANARKSIEDYQKSAEEKFRQYDADVRSGQSPAIPRPDEPPAIQAAKKIPPDLSSYITFLNNWMDEVLNQVILMLMFGLLVIATLIVLRLQDIG